LEGFRSPGRSFSYCAVTSIVGMGQQTAVETGAVAVTLADPIWPPTLVLMTKSVTPAIPDEPVLLM
jgi:hypothetical protein